MLWDDKIERIKNAYTRHLYHQPKVPNIIYSYRTAAYEKLLNACMDNPTTDPSEIIDRFELEYSYYAATAKTHSTRVAFETARNEILSLRDII